MNVFFGGGGGGGRRLELTKNQILQGFFQRKTHFLENYYMLKNILNKISHKNGTSLFLVKVRPHLYANANKACGTEANANDCQKVACSAFTAQANEQVFCWLFIGCLNDCTSTSVRWRTYFSLKYRLQTDSVRLFAEDTPHMRMKMNAVRLHVHITHFACVFTFVSHSCTDVDVA